MLLDADEFRQHFTDCRSAWRFETQPTYTVPKEQDSLRRFLAGGSKPEGHNAAWHERIRTLVATGTSIGRVRTVRRPLTDYQRYQLAWGIPDNIAAGEDIRILDLTGRRLDLPSQDFWLFDESVVVQLNFRPDGTLIDRVRLDEPDIEQYLKWRDTALGHAVPLSEWDARS